MIFDWERDRKSTKTAHSSNGDALWCPLETERQWNMSLWENIGPLGPHEWVGESKDDGDRNKSKGPESRPGNIIEKLTRGTKVEEVGANERGIKVVTITNHVKRWIVNFQQRKIYYIGYKETGRILP